MEDFEKRLADLEAKVNAVRVRTQPRYLKPEMVSEETPAAYQVLHWNDTNKKWRPTTPPEHGNVLKPVVDRTGLPGWFALSAISTAMVAGRMYLFPFAVKRSITVNQLALYVGVAGAAGTLARMAIYTGVNGRPSALVVDGGTVSTATTGSKTAAISQTLYGDYFTAVVCDGTPSFDCPDPSSGASSPGTTGMSASAGNQPFMVGFIVTGQTAVVAGGFASTAPTVEGYTTMDFNAVRIRWTD